MLELPVQKSKTAYGTEQYYNKQICCSDFDLLLIKSSLMLFNRY